MTFSLLDSAARSEALAEVKVQNKGSFLSGVVLKEFLTSCEKLRSAVSRHWLETDCISSRGLVFWSVFVLHCGFKYDFAQFTLWPHRFGCLFLHFCIKICCRCLIANGVQYATCDLEEFIWTRLGIQAWVFIIYQTAPSFLMFQFLNLTDWWLLKYPHWLLLLKEWHNLKLNQKTHLLDAIQQAGLAITAGKFTSEPWNKSLPSQV